jgi:hypothetical protein
MVNIYLHCSNVLMFLRFIQQKEIKISSWFPFFFLFSIAQGHISMTTTCCPFYPTDGGETLLLFLVPPPSSHLSLSIMMKWFIYRVHLEIPRNRVVIASSGYPIPMDISFEDLSRCLFPLVPYLFQLLLRRRRRWTRGFPFPFGCGNTPIT